MDDLTTRILAIAAEVGVPVSENKFRSYQYDGDNICAGNLSNLLHEIAHFQVCSPKRRFSLDWGLGTGPESGGFTKQELPHKECQEEEELASLLGIAWEFHLGMDGTRSLIDHGWHLYEPEEPATNTWLIVNQFFHVINKLERNGFLIQGKPTIKIRTWKDDVGFDKDEGQKRTLEAAKIARRNPAEEVSLP